MELGKIQKMRIARIEGQGAYLEDNSDEPAVLLPRKEVPEDAVPGMELEVFLYKDSEDRPITTINPPPLQVGTMAVLRVSQINRIGAFLDWGLMKELFLPYQEMRGRVEEGDRILVALYVDDSERLCATMRVYEYLRPDSPYHKDDVVRGTIYQVRDDLGALVAVDNRYYGLIPAKEIYSPLAEGEEVEARVARVCDDGKLDLALRKKAYAAMGDDAAKVLASIKERGGALPFTDKASPELIRAEFGMSKNEFKRAVGHLFKERKIVIEDDGIRLSDGKDRVSGAKDAVSGSKDDASEGKYRASEGRYGASEGKYRASDGKGRASDGKYKVSDGKGRASDGRKDTGMSKTARMTKQSGNTASKEKDSRKTHDHGPAAPKTNAEIRKAKREKYRRQALAARKKEEASK